MKAQLTLLFLFFSVPAFSQDFEEMLSRKPVVDCRTVSYNAGIHYVRYMEENKFDSLRLLLDYWEDKCGKQEPIVRGRILLALREHAFMESMLPNNMINHIVNPLFELRECIFCFG